MCWVPEGARDSGCEGSGCAWQAHQVEAGRGALREEQVVQHGQAAAGEGGVGAPDDVVGREARDEEEHGQDADHHALRRQVRQLLPHAAARRAEPPALPHPQRPLKSTRCVKGCRVKHHAYLLRCQLIKRCYAAVQCKALTSQAQIHMTRQQQFNSMGRQGSTSPDGAL